MNSIKLSYYKIDGLTAMDNRDFSFEFCKMQEFQSMEFSLFNEI